MIQNFHKQHFNLANPTQLHPPAPSPLYLVLVSLTCLPFISQRPKPIPSYHHHRHHAIQHPLRFSGLHRAPWRHTTDPLAGLGHHRTPCDHRPRRIRTNKFHGLGRHRLHHPRSQTEAPVPCRGDNGQSLYVNAENCAEQMQRLQLRRKNQRRFANIGPQNILCLDSEHASATLYEIFPVQMTIHEGKSAVCLAHVVPDAKAIVCGWQHRCDRLGH
jgi:hypothetical protein